MAIRGLLSFLVLAMAVILPLFIVFGTPNSTATSDSLGYKEGDLVPLLANVVFTGRDRSRVASPYFEMPFCSPGRPIAKRARSREEVMSGDCLINTQYELRFRTRIDNKFLCQKNLTKEEVAKFRDAIRKYSMYDMFYGSVHFDVVNLGSVEDLPVSENAVTRYYLANHVMFYPYHRYDQVVSMYAYGDTVSAIDITENVGIQVNFSYSVYWDEVYFSDKIPKLAYEPGGKEFIFPFIGYNLALFICIWLVRKVLMLYFQDRIIIRGDLEEGEGRDRDQGQESYPASSSLLGAMIGLGIQNLIMICSLLGMAYGGVLIFSWHFMYTCVLPLNCFASAVAGYNATAFQTKYSTERGWGKCVYQAAVLYYLPSVIIVLSVTSVPQLCRHFSDTLPNLQPVVIYLLAWGLSTLFFLTLGGSMGYGSNKKYEAPIRRRVRIDHQQYSWINSMLHIFLGFILPILVNFGKMDEIYASLWGFKVCGAFSTLFQSFLLTIAVTTFTSVYKTKFFDQQRWWSCMYDSLLIGYLKVAYGIYFASRLKHTNYMTRLIFLSYSICIFFVLSLVCGTIAIYASLFVIHKYMHREIIRDIRRQRLHNRRME